MTDKIIAVDKQILKINKVDGKGWAVFATMESTKFKGTFRQLFTFYTKKEAKAFCMHVA